MSDPVTKTESAPAAPATPKASKAAVKEVDQSVRHAAGQALGPNETLSNGELTKLHGEAPDSPKR